MHHYLKIERTGDSSECDLGPVQVQVGCDPICDLVVRDHRGIRPVHLTVTPRFEVKSAQGVWCNGRLVHEVVLDRNIMVTLDQHREVVLRLESRDEVPATIINARRAPDRTTRTPTADVIQATAMMIAGPVERQILQQTLSDILTVARLRAGQLGAASTRIGELEREITNLRDERGRRDEFAKSADVKAAGELRRVAGELAQKAAELEKRQAELEAERRKSAALEASAASDTNAPAVVAEIEAKIGEALRQRDAATSRVDELAAEVKRLGEHATAIDKVRIQAESRVLFLQAEIATSRERVTPEVHATVVGERDRSRQEVAEARRELEAATRTVRDLQVQLEEAERNRHEAVNQFTQSRLKMEKTQGELSRRVTELDKNAEGLRRELRDAYKVAGEARQRALDLEDEVQTLRPRFGAQAAGASDGDGQSATIAALKLELDSLNYTLEQKKSEAGRYEPRLAALEARNKTLDVDLDSAKAAMMRLEDERSGLFDRCKSLEEKLAGGAGDPRVAALPPTTCDERWIKRFTTHFQEFLADATEFVGDSIVPGQKTRTRRIVVFTHRDADDLVDILRRMHGAGADDESRRRAEGDCHDWFVNLGKATRKDIGNQLDEMRRRVVSHSGAQTLAKIKSSIDPEVLQKVTPSGLGLLSKDGRCWETYVREYGRLLREWDGFVEGVLSQLQTSAQAAG